MPPSIYSRYHGLDTIEIDGRVGLVQRPALSEDSAPGAAAPGQEPGSLLHVCVAGETLDQLARTYYGREDLWWRIADANPRRAPFEWTPGETLVIPPIRVATRTPRS